MVCIYYLTVLQVRSLGWFDWCLYSGCPEAEIKCWPWLSRLIKEISWIQFHVVVVEVRSMFSCWLLTGESQFLEAPCICWVRVLFSILKSSNSGLSLSHAFHFSDLPSASSFWPNLLCSMITLSPPDNPGSSPYFKVNRLAILIPCAKSFFRHVM